jgi:hypothetical protein
LQPFFTLIKSIAGFIVAYFAPAISETLGVAFKVVGTIISTVIDQFANFLGTLTAIFNAIKRIIDFGSIQFTQGAAEPSAAAPNGSMFLRTNGDASTTLYVRAGAAWKPLSSWNP